MEHESALLLYIYTSDSHMHVLYICSIAKCVGEHYSISMMEVGVYRTHEECSNVQTAHHSRVSWEKIGRISWPTHLPSWSASGWRSGPCRSVWPSVSAPSPSTSLHHPTHTQWTMCIVMCMYVQAFHKSAKNVVIKPLRKQGFCACSMYIGLQKRATDLYV